MKTTTLEIEQIKEKTIPILKEAGVTRSAIFGSYAAGENIKSSDIDMLVELPEDYSLLDYVRLQLKLEETLGRKIDLVEYSTIKPRIKERILSSQVPIL
ncbi:MAG TPA: nucleotidyltransferase family protein [Candidatus Nanoarchaeia archaeon]